MATSGSLSLSVLTRVRALVREGLGRPNVQAVTTRPAVSTSTAAPLYIQEFSAFKDKSLEQKVQEMVDREEIRELIARSAHRVAHGISVVDLFTDDGTFIARIPGRPLIEAKTRQGIAELFADWSPGNPNSPKPMMHNYLLVINGDAAAGTCSIETRATEGGQSIISSGYYNDKYRRENGRWKFVVRDVTFFHWVPIQEGWTTPSSVE